MKMKLFGSPRMVVSVMALALTVLSAVQDIAGCAVLPDPVHLAQIDGVNNADCRSASLTFTAGGGTPPYNYTLTSQTTQTNVPLGTGANFPSVLVNSNPTYTITDSSFPAQTVTGSFFLNGCFQPGGSFSYCFGPGLLNIKSNFPAQVSVQGFPNCDTPNALGGCTFQPLTAGTMTYTPTLEIASGPEFLLSFTMPAISPICFTAKGGCGSLTVTATGASKLFTATVNGPDGYSSTTQFSATTPQPLLIGLAAGPYTVVVSDAISTCTPAPAAQTVIVGPISSSLYLAAFSEVCSGPGSPVVRFTAGGGVPPYTYTYGTQPSQTQPLGTAAIFNLDTVDLSTNYTITDSAAIPNTISGSLNNGCPGFYTVCFLPNRLDTSSSFTGTASLSSQSGVCTTINQPGGCKFNNLVPGTLDTLTVTSGSGTSQLTFTTPTVAPICVSLAAGCGSLTVTVTGGSGFYRASTSGPNGYSDFKRFSEPFVLTGLAAGLYTVSIIDIIGCFTGDLFVQAVVSNSSLAFTTSTTAASCGLTNGAITASVTDTGTDTYTGTATGEVSGTFDFPTFVSGISTLTGLPADTYTVVITDTTSGCTGTQTGVIVGQGSILGLSALPNAPLCFGGAGALQYTLTESNPAAVTSVNVTETTSGYSQTYLSPISSPIIATIASAAFLAGASFNLTATDIQPGSTSGCTQTLMGTIPVSPTQLTVSSSVTPVSCNGGNDGTVTVQASGGTAPYSYTLGSTTNQTGIFTDLTAGSYTVSVTDANNCGPVTASATVSQPSSPLMVSISATPVSCNGGNDGTVTATASGGTAPYSYTLGSTTNQTGIFTDLAAGSYTVSVTDANDCGPVTASATVSQPNSSLTVSASATPASCNGGDDGTVTAVASGGTAPYNYTLGSTTNQTGIFTDLTEGSYTVSVTDANDCGPVTASATVSQPTEVLINVTNVTSPTCSGGTTGAISFSVSGGTANYTAALSGGATSVPPITNIPTNTTKTFSGLAASPNPYEITVADANGCIVSSGSITLSATGQINITVSSKSPTCFGGRNGSITFTVNNAVPNSTVVLKNSSNMTVKTITHVPNGVHQTISGLTAGAYSLTATDANGCSSTIPVNIAAGSRVRINGLSVSPILCNGGTAKVSFTISGGTPPYRSCLERGNRTFGSCKVCHDGACNAVQTFTGVPAGNYELEVTDAHGCEAEVAVTITQPQPLNFTIQTSNKSCPRNTSRLTVRAIGGTAPYRYQLDGGAFHQDGSSYSFGCVKNGSHSVTVKDANGCIKTAKIHVP